MLAARSTADRPTPRTFRTLVTQDFPYPMARGCTNNDTPSRESRGARVGATFGNEISAHTRRPNWQTERNGLTGRAWIERFWKLVDCDHEFEKRDVFFLIGKDDRLLAAGNLTVWRGASDDEFNFGWSLNDFVERADMSTDTAYETALAVARIWGSDDRRNWWTDDPFCTGYVCSFDRLLIDAGSSAEADSVWGIVDALIKRISRGLAVMVLKAFPLEYEGRVNDKTRPAFRRRQQALSRLYRRRLNAEPVPHEELAQAGWLFHLFKDGARPDPDP